MTSRKFVRLARRYTRVGIAFALVPLVGLGGLSLTACGCKGNFDLACHCQCHKGACCVRVASQSPCEHKTFAPLSKSQTVGLTVGGHQCTQVAGRIGIPAATTAPPTDDGYQILALATASDITATVVGVFEWHAMPIDVGPPPDDLILVLHRLVI
jgi:hypothetical protein